MLRLAIFDVDGTLVDSQATIVAAMAAGHDAAGLSMPSRERVLSIVGLSLDVACRALHPEAAPDRLDVLAEAYKRDYAARRARGEASPLFPGAREAIARLDAAGWLLAVATGKSRRGLDHLIAEHGFAGVLVATRTADEAPSKPHPAMVEDLLGLTGVEAGRAAMIGDTSFDMQMARAAGARAVGVAWGYHPPEALRTAGAETVIGDFADLDAALGGADQAVGS
ncbi:MAG: HAD hydrolase-like protein [Paracoccaceae bacterium]